LRRWLVRFGGLEMVCGGRGWELPGHVVYHDYCVSKGTMSSKKERAVSAAVL
jgi:hypothetical protein